VQLLGDSGQHHRYRLSQFDLNRYMRLDASAVRALNLMPAPGDRMFVYLLL